MSNRIQLPDVNVLIALHNPSHIHNERARQWFQAEGQYGWATCSLTENGFVRIFTQIQYPNDAQGAHNVIKLLEDTVRVAGAKHFFWPDSLTLRETPLLLPSAIAGPKQITDIYLLALCQQNGGTLVTLDAGITVSAIVSPHGELLRKL